MEKARHSYPLFRSITSMELTPARFRFPLLSSSRWGCATFSIPAREDQKAANVKRGKREGIQIRISKECSSVITHVVLDFNGTLAKDGKLLPEVSELLSQLSAQVEVIVATADTFDSVREALNEFPFRIVIISSGMEKAMLVTSLGAERVTAIGNGNNDVEMFKRAGFSIAVLGAEGLAATLIPVCSVVVSCIQDALNLLLHPQRITATIRD